MKHIHRLGCEVHLGYFRLEVLEIVVALFELFDVLFWGEEVLEGEFGFGGLGGRFGLGFGREYEEVEVVGFGV